MLNVLQVFNSMFNAVKHFNYISTFKWIQCKNMRSSEVVLLCVIVTETEMLRALPLTKLHSGKQCYIHTCAKVSCLGE